MVTVYEVNRVGKSGRSPEDVVGLLPKQVVTKFAKRLVFITFWPGPAQPNSCLLSYNTQYVWATE